MNGELTFPAGNLPDALSLDIEQRDQNAVFSFAVVVREHLDCLHGRSGRVVLLRGGNCEMDRPSQQVDGGLCR